MQVLTECNLAKIVVDLQIGKTLVFPTETSYGLGCDATNQTAVDKIFAIKGRTRSKSLLIVVPTIAEAQKYLIWNDLLEKISQKYWPGPLTVVGSYTSPPLKEGGGESQLAYGVVSAENTVAIRVTAHPLLQSITVKLGRPLVATSANLADAGDMYSAQDLVSIYQNQNIQPDILLDQGVLPQRKPTTIISVVNNDFKILRQGETKVVL